MTQQATASSEDALRDVLLALLSAAPDGISLPRLCKRLNLRMSVLLRTLAWLGEDAIGASAGAGLIRVEQREALQVAVLTDAGRAYVGKAAH